MERYHPLFLLAALLPGAAAAQNPVRPNILILVADDLGYADLGCQGSPDMKTPNIDSLAAKGLRFTNGYVSAPVCSPTRAGLITGRYQTRFGHEFNHALHDRAPSGVGLPLAQITAAQRFQAAGYATGHIGKWHLGDPRLPYYAPTARGFDDSVWFPGSTKLPPRPFVQDGVTRTTASPYVDTAMSREAANFIEAHRATPWFLYVSFLTPHVPLETPVGTESWFLSIEDPGRRKVAVMMWMLDRAVGTILDKLRATNQENRTLIFFLSDNGPIPRDGSYATPLSGFKATTWEGGLRVPFVMQWKSGLPRGFVIDSPVISLDILPTALAAAGISHEPLDGVNLLPFLTGRSAQPPHDALYWRFGDQWAVRSGDWKLVAARTNASSAETLVTRLVHLPTDVAEQEDLSAGERERVMALRQKWWLWNQQNILARWPNGSTGGADLED